MVARNYTCLDCYGGFRSNGPRPADISPLPPRIRRIRRAILARTYDSDHLMNLLLDPLATDLHIQLVSD